MKKSGKDKKLRRKAEEKVASQPVLSEETDVMHLLHELQVHQVELEMQNEELNLANEALQEYKTRMQNLINMTPAGYFRLDVDDCFVDVNDAWLTMHGYGSRDEIIGKHFSMLQVDRASDSALKHLEELHSGKPVPLGEFTSRRKDGSVGHHVFSAHPVLDTGRVVGFEWFIIDITERKQTEEELLAIQELFTLFMRYSPIYTFIKKIENNQSRIVQLSDNYIDMVGRPAEELRGQTMEDLFPPEFARKITADDLTVVNNGKVIEVDEDFNGRNYTSIKFPIFREGKDSLIAGFTIDITERKQADLERRRLEEQLHQLQKVESVGRLAGGVAHDYNNMLSVIIGHTELAKMQLDSTASVQKDLEEILQAACRSRDITRQLLAFARKQIIQPKVLDLNESVEGMLKMLQKLLGEHIEINWHPKEDLWPVEIDPSQLDQILANLCVNARDAITETGSLTIETGMETLDQDYCNQRPGLNPGDYVTLTVIDDGQGMDEDTLKNMFEPFFTTKEFGVGTGLGLATVYGIVKQSDGYIDVSSEPGKGTTFKIYLPRYEGPIEEVQDETVKEAEKGQGETVLLVEDEKAIVDLATAMLEELGYKVLAANTPTEALSLAETYQGEIRLLLTDVVMPEMNGRELAERLKTSYPELKYLYMSGYTADIIVPHGVLDEGIHFVQKPFSMNDLSAAIRAILD